MIYDSISNYAISVNLGHFTGLFTGIMIYDAISVKFQLFHKVGSLFSMGLVALFLSPPLLFDVIYSFDVMYLLLMIIIK
jgi:hypothetical protein